MGSSEIEKPAKEKGHKTPPASTQEQYSTTSTSTVNPDWSGFQAYSSIPPHGFIASNSPAHPYMWGVQHIMPPYGTPPHPYVAMYPHGGVFAHPSIPPGSYPFSHFTMPSPNAIVESSGNLEGEGKPSEVKEKLPIKRSKGSLGSLNMIAGMNNGLAKTSGASSNGLYSRSDESAGEGTSEGSDSCSQNESQLKSGCRQDSLEAEASQNGSSARGTPNGGPSTRAPNGGPSTHSMVNQTKPIVPMSAAGAPAAVSGPTTNLNIGMDYCGAPTSSTTPTLSGKVPNTTVAGGIVTAGTRDGIQPQLWLQDERELKRQRRKQSNRESARRSRLRKQAECDELAQRAEALKEENASLRSELNRIRSEYEQLLSENASLKEKLGELPGDEDRRPGRYDERLSNKTQQTTQSELKQGDN